MKAYAGRSAATMTTTKVRGEKCGMARQSSWRLVELVEPRAGAVDVRRTYRGVRRGAKACIRISRSCGVRKQRGRCARRAVNGGKGEVLLCDARRALRRSRVTTVASFLFYASYIVLVVLIVDTDIYKPKKEPDCLLAQILPASVPSHSTFKSSDKYLTSPRVAALTHPKMLSGKLQKPSVTKRERSKFALDVAARFLSFNSLFASVLASKSLVKSARAGATFNDTDTAAAANNAAARLVSTICCFCTRFGAA